jgi:hypothetical protein
MPRESRPRKTKRVDMTVMPETADPSTDRPPHVRRPGTRKEDWIASHLRQVYDDALSDAIPQQMLDLLQALDDGDDDSKDVAEKDDQR